MLNVKIIIGDLYKLDNQEKKNTIDIDTLYSRFYSKQFKRNTLTTVLGNTESD